jgi:hypothetical protein
LFTAIITDETIKTTQFDSFHDKYDAIKTFLEKTPLPQQGQLNALWNTIQEKYIQNEHRYIAFDDLKGMIIADPDHVNTYLEESLRLHNGEDLERSHITVPSGSATAFGGGGPMSHHGTVIPNNMTVRPEDP